MKIDEFRGDFDFLSNMYMVEFTDKYGAVWKSNEHWYQAAKTPHPLMKMLIWDAPDGYTARRLANDPKLRDRFFSKEKIDEFKDVVMFKGLTLKFSQNEDILRKLLSTEGFELIEGNKWHDNYWGDCRCKKCEKIQGLNKLGTMIMQVRLDLRRYYDENIR